jgi:hypothetical protein
MTSALLMLCKVCFVLNGHWNTVFHDGGFTAGRVIIHKKHDPVDVITSCRILKDRAGMVTTIPLEPCQTVLASESKTHNMLCVAHGTNYLLLSRLVISQFLHT